MTTRDFETAAELCNLCTTQAVQAAHTDFLIAAVAIHREYAVLQVTLPPDEQSALVKSAAVLQEAIEQLEFAVASKNETEK